MARDSGRARPLGIDARGWGWRHAGRRAFAVRGLDLRVEPGERVLLLGPSGAGKSTLLLGLAGLLGGEHEGEEDGALLVGGRPARQARQGRDGAGPPGLLLQDPDAQVVLARCGDDVAFGLENTGVPADRIWPRVREALAAVGFPYPLDHPTAALSGGEKQRLALAGVLAMRPGLLLLDEPTANLDPDGVRMIRDTVADAVAATGATLVVVEHRVATWLDVVDRVVVLEPGGGVAADGSPERVLHEEGPRLAAAGVWVPGRRPPVPPRARGVLDPAAPPLLDADDLDVRRPGAAGPAAAGLRLSLEPGQAWAVVGPNGSGKSTLALTAGGLLAPAGGTLAAGPALTRGLDPRPYRWKARQLVERIGSVFQDPEHQFLTATVRAELEHGPRLLGVPPGKARQRADALLERTRLTRLAEANPYTLSGGEKRRLSVATALATRPTLLVLDEPTFGQDSRTWAELAALLVELLDDGRAVLMATHDDDLVAQLADRVLTLGPAALGGPVLDARAEGAAPRAGRVR